MLPYTHIMRMALALLALMCSPVSIQAFPADDIPYCSDGFEKPAKIVLGSTQPMFLTEGNDPTIRFDAPQRVTLSIGDRTEVFSFHEPDEGAMVLYYDRYHDLKSAVGSPIGEGGSYLAEAMIGKTKVLIFADRVFWPCDK